MPLYEYACRTCGHRFERMQKVSARLDAPACPACGKPTTLALSTPGHVGVGGGGGGIPTSASHGHGCGPGGCCGGACGS